MYRDKDTYEQVCTETEYYCALFIIYYLLCVEYQNVVNNIRLGSTLGTDDVRDTNVRGLFSTHFPPVVLGP